MNPIGNDEARVGALQKDANQVAALITSSWLTKAEAFLAHYKCWLPSSVSYSLSTTTLQARDLWSIQAKALSTFLQKLGFNMHFPRALVYGPKEMGGLNLRDLVVEQGISQVVALLEHLYNQTEMGRMILILLATLQMEAGSEGPLLYNTTPTLSYITACWIGSIRNFFCKHQLQLQIAIVWNFLHFHSSGFISCMDLKHLNAARLHLQLATIADITTANSKFI